MSKRRLRLGLIGVGWWSSQVHAPAIASSELAELVAVSDPIQDRGNALAARFDALAFADHRRMLADVDLDGVVIATPHSTHASLAVDCLTSGVGVLVEKPMTVNGREAWELVELGRQRSLPVVVGQPYPFHPQAGAVRKLLQAGVIGDLCAVTGSFHSKVAEFYRGRPQSYSRSGRFAALQPLPSTYADVALSGGGQGQTQLSHLVSLLLWELDNPVTGVHARMKFLQPGLDISVAMTAVSASGAPIGLVSAGTATGPRSCTAILRYDGSEGWIEHNALQGILTASDGVDLGGIPDSRFGIYPTAAPVDSLIRELAQCRPTTGVTADGVLGARTVDVIEACYRSALAPSPTSASPGRAFPDLLAPSPRPRRRR